MEHRGLDEAGLLADLTAEQGEAVTTEGGALLILAGAGSGKTRVLTRRVAWLIGRGVEAASILAITFTNKAAGEMKSRIGDLLGWEMRDFGKLDQRWPTICTFHSLGLRTLKYYSKQAGLGANFAIFDSGDQEKLIKEAVKSSDLSVENFPAGMVAGQISDAKNKLTTAEQFQGGARDFFTKNIGRIYGNYQKLLGANNAVDFDDLLMKTAFLFREHKDVLGEMQARFGSILIDEYQDTNHAQYVIAHAMALSHGNICVVGDPDQSIYGWRGADVRNILEFERDYPKAKVIKLERNYRSTKRILAVASELIAKNRKRKEKGLWTENEEGEKVKMIYCGDEHEEANRIALELKKLADSKAYSWSEMAVFYRVNALSRVMEDALRRMGLPYRMARGVSYYQRKEVKDVVGYLKLVANVSDEVNLARVINTPTRGISPATLKAVGAFASGMGIGLYEGLKRIGEVGGLTKRALGAVAEFVGMVEGWRGEVEKQKDPEWRTTSGKGRVASLIEEVIRKSGMEKLLIKTGGEERAELANANELITAGEEYDEANPEGSLEEYLAQVSLVSDLDSLKDNGGAISMLTLHSAKGLEYPVVVMIGLEEGILPHSRVQDHPEQVEEERRLCFVGITRARKLLIMSKANVRTLRGQRLATVASRFLAEMNQDALEVAGAGAGFGRSQQVSAGASQWDRGDSRGEEREVQIFEVGQRVRHPAFGVGRILEINKLGGNTRVQVDFFSAGRKTIILEYATLTATE